MALVGVSEVGWLKEASKSVFALSIPGNAVFLFLPPLPSRTTGILNQTGALGWDQPHPGHPVPSTPEGMGQAGGACCEPASPCCHPVPILNVPPSLILVSREGCPERAGRSHGAVHLV